ncbi:MAG: thioredoxin-disulfide reductase [Anaerolineae bacterium]
MDAEQQEDQVYDLIILGGGPAGLTAAIYAGRAALRTLVFASSLPGGQVANAEKVENFPGFPEGIAGPDLAQRLHEQAQRFGATVMMEGVREVDFSAYPLETRTSSEIYCAWTVIIATGTFPRRLGVSGESKFYGRGVSTCATCDGFLYQDRRVVVVGGGDSAIEEGLFLTRFASEVIVIHRRDELRACSMLQERAFANPKMRFVWDSVVEEILGDETVKGVRIRNVKTDETSVLDTDGVFVYIGLIPATKIFKGQVDMDDNGYIITDHRQRTSAQGVFAAGDVQNPEFRQIVVAAGAGAMAAMEVNRFLGRLSHATAGEEYLWPSRDEIAHT